LAEAEQGMDFWMLELWPSLCSVKSEHFRLQFLGELVILPESFSPQTPKEIPPVSKRGVIPTEQGLICPMSEFPQLFASKALNIKGNYQGLYG